MLYYYFRRQSSKPEWVNLAWKKKKRRIAGWNKERKGTVCLLCMRELLTRATRLTMLMLKLMFCSADSSGLGSIQGIVSSHAETYIIGAERNVLITIPEVIWKNESHVYSKMTAHLPSRPYKLKLLLYTYHMVLIMKNTALWPKVNPHNAGLQPSLP